MPLKALETRRLYHHIADQIRDLIARGEFAVGTRLPPERDIAKQLSVSRTSVREALIALELGGMVEIKGGSGVYVKNSASSVALAIDVGVSPFDLLRARRVVEGEIAVLAAKLIDAEGLKALDETIQIMDASDGRSAERDHADKQFHLRIAEASRNSALIQVERIFWDMRHGPIWRKMEEHFHGPRLLAAVITDHKAIFSALRAHNPTAARSAMHRHLTRVEKEFTKKWNDPAPDQPIAARGPVRRRSAR
jgi:GntR family uxuAB operon transcriptional repressor